MHEVGALLRQRAKCTLAVDATAVGSTRANHRSGRRRRRREVPAGRARGVPRRPAHRRSSTPATTSRCTGCGSAPTSTACMYTLGEVHDHERGWGRAGETWRIKDELAAYGAEPSWFSLGDLDIATHLVRTRMLDAGYPLTDVTAALCERWQPGRAAAADDRRPLRDPRRGRRSTARRQAIHFQEWWIRHRAALPGRRRSSRSGSTTPTPAPGVLEAITAADVVLLAPRNPVVSIGTILGRARHPRRRRRRPGAGRRALADHRRRARCAAWPTPACRRSASRSAPRASGAHYGARTDGGLLDGWLIHDTRHRGHPRRRGARRPAADDRRRRDRGDGARPRLELVDA